MLVSVNRPIRIAFSGASGTGKSTLVAFVAKRYGLEPNPVGSRSVALEMGFANPYDVDAAGKRAEFQRRLLAGKVAWEAEREAFVTDRTTCDQLLYAMLHDVKSIDVETIRLVRQGMARYTHVVYCPVARFRSKEVDPARVSNESYHEIYDAALVGLLKTYTAFSKLWDLQSSDLEQRQEDVVSFIEGIR